MSRWSSGRRRRCPYRRLDPRCAAAVDIRAHGERNSNGTPGTLPGWVARGPAFLRKAACRSWREHLLVQGRQRANARTLGRDAPSTPAPHPDTDINSTRGSEASSIWSTICANRYAKVGSHLAAQIARYKVGAEFRLHSIAVCTGTRHVRLTEGKGNYLVRRCSPRSTRALCRRDPL